MTNKWVPLEASPEVFNAWAEPLGLTANHPLTFQDLFSLDEDFLSFIPGPHKAVLLLFPDEGALGKARDEEKAQDEHLLSEGEGIWWIRQEISNACGSIGLLHALLNLPDEGDISLGPQSQLRKFKQASLSLSGIDRAGLLDKSDFFSEAHTSAASSGQSNIPTDLDVNTHFITFIQATNSKGEKRIVELDGRRKGPFDQGPSSSESSFLSDVAKVVQKKYIDRADGDINFSLIVLAGKGDE